MLHVICVLCRFCSCLLSFLFTVQDGVSVVELRSAGVTRPVLLSAEGSYWVKVDSVPLQIFHVSCLPDAFEFLLAVFFVFNVQYPHELRNCYSFLEKVLGMKPTTGKSAIVNELYSNCLRV